MWISNRIDWLVLRHFGHAGEVIEDDDGGKMFETEYSDPRQLVSWVLGLGEHARVVGPPELEEEARASACARDRAPHASSSRSPQAASGAAASGEEEAGERPRRGRRSAPSASRAWSRWRGHPDRRRPRGEKLDTRELCADLQVTDTELREDIDVLNVVNFGGGSYVVYAEVQGDTIEVDPEPYGDNFARPRACCRSRPRRWWPPSTWSATTCPRARSRSARQKVVDALGHDPAAEGLQITTAKGDDSDVARVLSRRDRRPPAW